ncbi:MAG: aldo/keto reductase [Candidatus Heimdallarchaeota archaeon]|nr:aldo/keto reductase [Candidatus Heimdallarchaeota archaeon]
MNLMNDSQVLHLNNGVKIPILGLGTWHSRGEDLANAINWALEAGYRHIDTAMTYANERIIGRAIKKNKIKREETFLTTKLWINFFEPTKLKNVFEKSLKNLNTDYIDLFLLHWPAEGYLSAWKELEKIYADGRARAIGVSNFKIHHLENLKTNFEITPVVNQIEFTPYLYDKEIYDYCKKHSIKIEAYSPLTRGEKLGDSNLISIAKRYNKSTAQILLRWGIQMGLIEIPKSTNEKRIIENIQIFDFEINKEDMNYLCNLNENLRVPGSKKHEELMKKYQ